MDKNVGSVNLDELKAAREALNRERGVENDPNMYNDYDPEKHKAEREQDKLARENSSNDEAGDDLIDETQESNIDTPEQTLNEPVEHLNSEENTSGSHLDLFEVSDNDSYVAEKNSDDESVADERVADETEDASANEISNVTNDDYARSPEVESLNDKDDNEPLTNFDVYENFADFEINSEISQSSKPEVKGTDESAVLKENDLEETTENEENSEDSSSLDSFLSELDSILSKEESDDEEIADDNIEESNNADDSNLEELLELESENKNSTETNEENETNSSNNGLEKFAVDQSTINYSDEEIINNASEKTEVLTDFSKLSQMAEEIEVENSAQNQPVETEVENKTEEVDDSEDVDENEEEDVEVGGYTKIQEFNFVDIMSSEEFKDEDKLSYILGKDDNGDIVYSNLRDTCGTAVFSRNEDAVFDQFSSILLSLLLKNTPEEVQFVVCDAMYDSEFDVFNDSSYMYFNRVAKNNREIVDSLVELSKELETRYNNLVYAGVKSISAYNLQAEERGSAKMPYIVLFLNNYAKMTQFLDADRINVCLHNILKFGRIAGIYAVIASTSEIERNDINFNLPTRICYRVEDAHESVAALCREGAENLKSDKDFLYSTIYDEEIRHLRVPSLTQKEIELIIENLEN